MKSHRDSHLRSVEVTDKRRRGRDRSGMPTRDNRPHDLLTMHRRGSTPNSACKKGCGRRTPQRSHSALFNYVNMSGNPALSLSGNTNDGDKSWFQIWEDGLRANNAEKRWAGLFGLIDAAEIYADEEQYLQPLLELAFWEATETLSPSHPRKHVVMNLFMTLSTWEGYLRVTWTYMKLWWRGWVETVFRSGGISARMENLVAQREQIRTAMRSKNITSDMSNAGLQ